MDRCPVAFHGRMGGMVPTPDEVLAALQGLVQATSGPGRPHVRRHDWRTVTPPARPATPPDETLHPPEMFAREPAPGWRWLHEDVDLGDLASELWS